MKRCPPMCPAGFQMRLCQLSKVFLRAELTVSESCQKYDRAAVPVLPARRQGMTGIRDLFGILLADNEKLLVHLPPVNETVAFLRHKPDNLKVI
ncbi:MAG: hypothetical protein J6K19_01960 [Prevotella sp.]|nr:hypothetical protein [Prevotella sp.]